MVASFVSVSPILFFFTHIPSLKQVFNLSHYTSTIIFLSPGEKNEIVHLYQEKTHMRSNLTF